MLTVQLADTNRHCRHNTVPSAFWIAFKSAALRESRARFCAEEYEAAAIAHKSADDRDDDE